MNENVFKQESPCGQDDEKLFEIDWEESSQFFRLIWARSEKEARLRWLDEFKDKFNAELICRQLSGGPVVREVSP